MVAIEELLGAAVVRVLGVANHVGAARVGAVVDIVRDAIAVGILHMRAPGSVPELVMRCGYIRTLVDVVRDAVAVSVVDRTGVHDPQERAHGRHANAFHHATAATRRQRDGGVVQK